MTLVEGFRKTVIYRPKQNTEKEVVYFVAKYNGGEIKIQQEELSAAVWVGIGRAASMVTFDNDKRLISGAKKFLAEN